MVSTNIKLLFCNVNSVNKTHMQLTAQILTTNTLIINILKWLFVILNNHLSSILTVSLYYSKLEADKS